MPYILYFFILLIIINIYFRLADRYNIIDNPCERSSHKRPVLRGGGIIFPVGIILWFIWSGYLYPWFFAGLMIISLVSFLDDISGIKLLIRLLIHFISIILIILQLDTVTFPWWAWIVLLIFAAGVINAFNFMDGINGITTGYSLSVLTGLWFVNQYKVHFIESELIYAIVIALIVFGIYNFRTRARCFAGDVGSVSVSFILIFLLAKLVITSGNIFYVMFLAVYGVDTFLTLLGRALQRENIFTAHRRHLFQLLANEAALPQLAISAGYALAQLIISMLIIILSGSFQDLFLAVVSITLIIILFIVYFTAKRKILTYTRVENLE